MSVSVKRNVFLDNLANGGFSPTQQTRFILLCQGEGYLQGQSLVFPSQAKLEEFVSRARQEPKAKEEKAPD